MRESPVAHSTPKIVPLQKRRSIRDFKQSAIKKLESNSDSSMEDSDVSADESDVEKHSTEELEQNSAIDECPSNRLVELEQNNYIESEQLAKAHLVPNGFTPESLQFIQNDNNYMSKIIFVIVIFSAVIVCAFKMFNLPEKNIPSIMELTQKYPKQEDDFWLSFQVLVEDTIKYNQPKCLILLYNDDAKYTTELLLNDLSSYAVCKITSCYSSPIIFEAHEFGEKDVNFDYGEIIARNKAGLRKSGVMIVKNLEKIFANSAMAFQSLCDEYQPVVPNALIILTLKWKQQPEDKNKYVENVLRNLWNDLNDDLFYPLLTRITNFIFVIQKDKNFNEF